MASWFIKRKGVTVAFAHFVERVRSAYKETGCRPTTEGWFFPDQKSACAVGVLTLQKIMRAGRPMPSSIGFAETELVFRDHEFQVGIQDAFDGHVYPLRGGASYQRGFERGTVLRAALRPRNGEEIS